MAGDKVARSQGRGNVARRVGIRCTATRVGTKAQSNCEESCDKASQKVVQIVRDAGIRWQGRQRRGGSTGRIFE